ncbi:hypothetical protein B0O99DRAFT_525141 [Bisporella sp. PMI_857]|nr:hypothetical protein B0O99DRAFT_525141 [Bisporella sp. PMI_857]
MRPYDNNRSPVLAFSPQPAHQSSLNMGSHQPFFSSPFSNASKQSQSPTNSTWSSLVPTPSAPTSAAGRKRSRDEAALNLEDDYFAVQQPSSQPTSPEKEEDWEYGEGMTLVKPGGSGYIIPAGSQTGTWAEEKVDEETKAIPAAPVMERPYIRSAKSQRLDLTSTPAIQEEIMSNGNPITPAAASPSNGYSEPTVDDFTRHLGIGWSLISSDPDIQAAARGWTKFINNHFPVTDAKIRLQSKGLASYLVEANEGFFLFGEDLKQGRLVSTSLENTWTNLGGPVPTFEGSTTMDASQTPKADDSSSSIATGVDLEMNGAQASISGEHTNTTEPTMEVEMDMS